MTTAMAELRTRVQLDRKRRAVRSLNCPRVVLDAQPSQRAKLNGGIIQKLGVIYSEDGSPVPWVIMPVNVASTRK